MDVLILRFDAPLMSFGAPIVDNRGVTEVHPTLSMVTGLLGNSLGYDHSDADRLQDLQRRLRIAARCDRPGERLTDFQTADLGQPFLAVAGWTTRSRVERRGGGSAKRTHRRWRDYLADAVYTVALTLEPPAGTPTLDDIATALDFPARPLFLGRKPCLPATRLLVGRAQVATLCDALCRRYAAVDPVRGEDPTTAAAWWPDGEDVGDGTLMVVTDERDWTNQIHGGQRFIRHGTVDLRGEDHAD